MSKPIPAIAAVDMPFGTYVEVDANGFARPDPTFECRGGVVRRPGGSNNSCRSGDSIKVETEGHIQMLNPHGLNVSTMLEGGRVKGGPAAVPGFSR